MTTALVTLLGQDALELIPWVLPLLGVLGFNLMVASLRLDSGRWLAAVLVAACPLLLPDYSWERRHFWGISATITTTLAIVSAARLAELGAWTKARPRSTLERFLWLTLPMLKGFSQTAEQQESAKGRAPELFRTAGLEFMGLVPIFPLVFLVDGDVVPWPLKSAVLILYFVLHLSAIAHLLSGLCAGQGLQIDALFLRPLLATSPRDFWSRRWNRFISRFALKHVALKLAGKVQGIWLILAVFLVSGVFHEYFAWGVGSAGARHGLMTFFFLIQGLLVWTETRVPFFFRGWRGTILTFLWMMLTAPLFFLAIELALTGFGFPPSWIPRPALLMRLLELLGAHH